MQTDLPAVLGSNQECDTERSTTCQLDDVRIGYIV